jgi:hypothetical protein
VYAECSFTGADFFARNFKFNISTNTLNAIAK